MKMKKNLFLTILLSTALLLVFSCKKDSDLATLELSNMIAPSLVSPTASALVLTEESENDSLEFGWTAAEYGLDLSVTYNVEIDATGNDFANALFIGSSESLTFKITKKEFNTLMTQSGYPELAESVVDIRVRASVNDNVDDLVTDAKKMTITTYAGDVPPLYLLGDATIPGWSNVNALELTYTGNGKYQIQTTLTSGSVYWKLIGVLGQWAPQWGIDSGDWASGTLAYRATEDDPDPDAIPAPPSDGDYIIKVDKAGLTYTVEAVK